ncbi:hypothetical protein AADZ90_005005 [Aestuariibius sp. 2305UL40-4]|uniref:hypothetical protein n=1 Tax=Aestuariibius violaceus TaxID=3234132 RepID=UPI00345E7D05
MRATLTLAGPVSLVDSEGQDRTPLSMKARGILAILGTAREHRMSRAKLQDKLWSERSPEQGSASLRQALTEIRRTFGPLRSALVSGPGWIGLDPNVIDISLDLPANAVPETTEFADDLDIRDSEFEEWLLLQRQHFSKLWSAKPATAVSRDTRPTIRFEPAAVILTPPKTGDKQLDGFADLALRDAAQRASDFLPLRIFHDASAKTDFPDAVEVHVRGIGAVHDLALHVSICRGRDGQQIWSRTFETDRSRVANRFREVSGETTLALLHAGSADTESDARGSSVSLTDVFGYSRSNLLRADSILGTAEESHTVLALRAYIRNTQILERQTEDFRQTRQEATDFADRALRMAPQNATVLSVSSFVAVRNGHLELASDLANRAVRADPGNLLAHISRSVTLAQAGRHDEAHADALTAHQDPLSALSPASSAIGCSVTAVRAGRLDEALRYAAISHGYAPTFRPALRFLAALHFKLGNVSEAETALYRLRELEPDFSLELMSSPEYPVASLRAARLLDITHSQLI